MWRFVPLEVLVNCSDRAVSGKCSDGANSYPVNQEISSTLARDALVEAQGGGAGNLQQRCMKILTAAVNPAEYSPSTMGRGQKRRNRVLRKLNQADATRVSRL